MFAPPPGDFCLLLTYQSGGGALTLPPLMVRLISTINLVVIAEEKYEFNSTKIINKEKLTHHK